MRKHLNLSIVFFILSLLVFAFVTTPKSNDLGEPVVWFYNGLPTYYCVALSVIFWGLTFIYVLNTLQKNYNGSFHIYLYSIRCYLPHNKKQS